jgi:hypothetical protein
MGKKMNRRMLLSRRRTPGRWPGGRSGYTRRGSIQMQCSNCGPRIESTLFRSPDQVDERAVNSGVCRDTDQWPAMICMVFITDDACLFFH